MTAAISNIVGAVAFGVLLIAGLLVNSQDVWAEVSDGGWDSPLALALMFFAFTPTNLLCVAIVSAFFSDKIVPRSAETQQTPYAAWWSSVGVGIGVWVGMLISQAGNPGALLKADQEGYFVLLAMVAGAALGIGSVQTTIANRQAEMIQPTVYTRRQSE